MQPYEDSTACNAVSGTTYCGSPSSPLPTIRCVIFFSSRRRHTRCLSDWSSDVCSSDLKKDLETNWNVCPKCGAHSRIDAVTRLNLLLDDGEYTRHDTELRSSDPLGFVDSKPYSERLKSMQQATKLGDAMIAAEGRLCGRPVQVCAMEPKFIGGSMGSVVGEMIMRAIERSMESRQPLLIVSASGGARMQEGAVSLMQMAKISSGLMRLDEARLPFISILTDPTTGGVTASYAMLGDLN